MAVTTQYISQAWIDKGFWTREYADHVITVGYKDEEFAAYSQLGVTRDILDAACARYEQRVLLGAPVSPIFDMNERRMIEANEP